MTLLWKQQDNHHRTNSISSVGRLRSLIVNRKTSDKSIASKAPSYRDGNLQQNLIGQQPTYPPTHRQSSRSKVLAWRSQLSSSKVESKRDQYVDYKNTGGIKNRLNQNSSTRSPLPKAFTITLKVDRNLHSKASMSFPHHLRTQSQPLRSTPACNSVLFPSIDEKVTYNRQPWWDVAAPLHVIGIDSSKIQASIELETTSKHHRYPVKFKSCSHSNKPESIPSKQDGSDPSSATEIESIAAEVQTSSDASFITCHTSPYNVPSSVTASSPTLCSPAEKGTDFCKDACQSPLCDDYTFSPHAACYDDFPDHSCSVEILGIHAEGSCIGNMQSIVRDSIKCTVEDDSSPQQVVKKQIDLSDFLQKVHSREEAEFDESFGSSSFDDEEDAAQICHAWRAKIAFAGLGASLINTPLHIKAMENVERCHVRNESL